MVVEPGETPDTSPVPFTVATAVFELTQGVTPAGVPEPVNWVVAPTHALSVPPIVGNGFTVTVTLVLPVQPVAVTVPTTL